MALDVAVLIFQEFIFLLSIETESFHMVDCFVMALNMQNCRLIETVLRITTIASSLCKKYACFVDSKDPIYNENIPH